MDGWLKALVAAACLMIVASGAYIFWKELAAGKKEAETQEAAAAAAYEAGCRDSLENLLAYKQGATSSIQGSFADNKAVVSACLTRLAGTDSAKAMQRDLDSAQISIAD